MTPNWFAIFALAAWPAVAICLFSMLPRNQALLWTILGAHLILPVGADIKFAMVPSIDKNTIASCCALAGCLLVKARSPRISRQFGLTELLMLMCVVGPGVSAVMNDDPLYFGELVLPGAGWYDAVSSMEASILVLVPFVLGRRYLMSARDNFLILRTLVIGGLVYSLPLLFEIRFSPVLHLWIYGYSPSEFMQSLRAGGYRPMAFMGHGLMAAFFIMTGTVAATALWRSNRPIFRFPALPAAGYLGVILILCKSAAAAVYGAGLVTLVRFASPRLQVRIASILVSIALIYPVLRSFDVFPTQLVVGAADFVSADRAASMIFRFRNEDQLLAHAFERPLFGWGRFGRGRIYNDEGRDISVTDGHWIQTFGQFGFFGFLAEFGLLTLAVFRSVSAIKNCGSATERIIFAALVLIVSISVVDQLPNSALRPWTWLLCGALLGRIEMLKAESRQAKPRSLAIAPMERREMAM